MPAQELIRCWADNQTLRVCALQDFTGERRGCAELQAVSIVLSH